MPSRAPADHNLSQESTLLVDDHGSGLARTQALPRTVATPPYSQLKGRSPITVAEHTPGTGLRPRPAHEFDWTQPRQQVGQVCCRGAERGEVQGVVAIARCGLDGGDEEDRPLIKPLSD